MLQLISDLLYLNLSRRGSGILTGRQNEEMLVKTMSQLTCSQHVYIVKLLFYFLNVLALDLLKGIELKK